MADATDSSNDKGISSLYHFSYNDFFNIQVDKIVNDYSKKDSLKFEECGFENALTLFYQAAERVPAYGDFLKRNNIDYKKIKTLEDFKTIPIINKKNYLRAYNFKDLLWDGKLDNLSVLSSSSGSTGEPFLWPRGELQELESALQFEVLFKTFYEIDKKSTLFIDCFAMGTWIAGPLLLNGMQYLSKKGYPVLTITPGIDKNITFSLFKSLANSFDQIIFGGYPPLIKDIIDLGEKNNINWKDYKIKFYFAAEGFTEKWRDHIHEKVGSTDIFTTSINLYGSADAANLGHETPLTTAIRREITKYPKLNEVFFKESRLPSLVQYDPRSKYFESIEGNLIFTTNSGIPLIRYSIGDQGGVYKYKEMLELLEDNNIPYNKIYKETNFNWNLPFVYVFGRSDFTVSYYGLLIYPEHIKYGLEKKAFSKKITGKFVMSTENNINQDPYLLIRVELAEGVQKDEALQEKIQKSVTKGLKVLNSEYHKLNQSLNGPTLPVIELVTYGDSQYFKPGIKQKWVEKH